MKELLAILLFLFFNKALATPAQEGPRLPEGHVACNSANEFEKSVTYLRGEKSLPLNDSQVVKWSLKIIQGCTGAVERFRKIYELLNRSGVDIRKAVEMAAEFSTKTDEQALAFAGLFKTFFLENYFDLDFMTAFEISNKLAENPAKADFSRKDFERLFKFCTDQDKLGLPLKNCAQYSIGLLKHYELYPEGLFPSFEKAFQFISRESRAVLNVKETLEITGDILAYGPLAPQSFIDSYKFSVAKKGLDTSAKQGMRVALEVAKASLKKTQ